MLAMAGLPAPGGARRGCSDAPLSVATAAHSFGLLAATAEAADLQGMGVEEAYEEQGAVDVDGMTYEVRPLATLRMGHRRLRFS